MRFVSARNQASAAAGSGVNRDSPAASTTAKRASSGVAAQTLPDSAPAASAIHVGLPSPSSATASGSTKAAAETAAADRAETIVVPVNGASSRAKDASIQSTTKVLDLTPGSSAPFTASTFTPLDTSAAGTVNWTSTASWPSNSAAPTGTPLNRNSARWSGSFVELDQPIARTASATSPAAPARSSGNSFTDAALVPATT